MEILLNSAKSKISNNSHQIALSKIEKTIENAVNLIDVNKTKKISFIQLGEILTELKLFREVFPTNDNSIISKELETDLLAESHLSSKILYTKPKKQIQNKYSYKKEIQSYKDIKIELKNVKNQEKRKRMEVDFYEQLWFKLNPEGKTYIRSDVLCEFLKIIFTPICTSVDEIASILNKLLSASFFLNCSNNDEVKAIVSPITDKSIGEEEIWQLDKLIREFQKLKNNILAYQNIKNLNEKTVKTLTKASVKHFP